MRTRTASRLGTKVPRPSLRSGARYRLGVLACPNCALALTLGEWGATCANGHSFDRGRGGYLNLLLGGRLGPTVTPGDTPDALAARRRFLGGGHYAPIAAALAAAVGEPSGAVLDIGCGEGYYLSRLNASERYGVDISKTAVQMAARAYPNTQFVVASAYRLPVLDEAACVVVSVFAPHPFEEFDRVLRPGGHWVTVTPGPLHLREMRPVLHGDSADKDAQRLERRSDPPAEATSAERVGFTLDLDAGAAQDLYLMTPLRWQSAVRSDGPMTVTVDVWVARN